MVARRGASQSAWTRCMCTCLRTCAATLPTVGALTPAPPFRLKSAAGAHTPRAAASRLEEHLHTGESQTHNTCADRDRQRCKAVERSTAHAVWRAASRTDKWRRTHLEHHAPPDELNVCLLEGERHVPALVQCTLAPHTPMLSGVPSHPTPCCSQITAPLAADRRAPVWSEQRSRHQCTHDDEGSWLKSFPRTAGVARQPWRSHSHSDGCALPCRWRKARTARSAFVGVR
jgi:hypothetical protein